jgi:hypothetical protein
MHVKHACTLVDSRIVWNRHWEVTQSCFLLLFAAAAAAAAAAVAAAACFGCTDGKVQE